jgi:hypothetical protein
MGGTELNRKAFGYFGTFAAILCIAWVQAVSGQERAKAAGSADAEAQNFQKIVLPVLSKNCFTCHSQKLETAGLNLQAFGVGSVAVQHKEVWAKVLQKLSSGQMPPRGLPAPSKSEVAAVTNWINHLLSQTTASPAGASDPGRVTARRLNRAEYNSTVHDLLGVYATPADEFPVDDSGYGFDNNGDVLSISPLLMEKYLKAARELSHLAVYGPTIPAEPTVLAVLMPKKGPDDTANSSIGIILPYSMRGSLYGHFVFPVDGVYEIRIRVRNYRDKNGIKYDAPEDEFVPSFEAAMRSKHEDTEGASGGGGARPAVAGRGRGRGPRKPLTDEERKARDEQNRLAFPPIEMVVTLDGKKIGEDSVEGNTNYMYDRGDVIVRVPVTAGDHYLRASYPSLADLDDPRRNINPDGRRRDYLERAQIVGPFDPSTAPPESYRKIFVCQEQTPACARKIVENLGTRAYRRPMTKAEIDQLAGLVAMVQNQGDSFKEGVRVAVEAILVSPKFLFRIETDPKPVNGAVAAAHPLNDFELASRLSYFLWSTMPDDELFRLARQGSLHQPVVLQAQIKRMLADPKAEALVDDFGGEWLGIRNLDRKSPDPDRFPTTDDELLDYMHTETNLFVAAMFREDHSILDFIDAPFTYLNGPLANHYGIPGIKGEAFQRVDLKGTNRGGVLTQGSVLIVSSYPTRTSVVTRGRWVLDNFLGSAPPPPPPGVPALVEGDIGTTASLRQKMEQHRANPACAVCHLQMDPIGFGLENYDASGAWRTHDGKFPIDASGTLPDGESFSGALGLEHVLRAKSQKFAQHFTEELMTYALGRGLEQYDQPMVDRIVADDAAHDYRFSRLVSDIVNSRAFRMRGADPAAKSTTEEGER